MRLLLFAITLSSEVAQEQSWADPGQTAGLDFALTVQQESKTEVEFLSIDLGEERVTGST